MEDGLTCRWSVLRLLDAQVTERQIQMDVLSSPCPINGALYWTHCRRGLVQLHVPNCKGYVTVTEIAISADYSYHYPKIDGSLALLECRRFAAGGVISDAVRGAALLTRMQPTVIQCSTSACRVVRVA